MQSLEHTTPEGIKFRYQPVLVADPADTQWGYIRSPYLARLGKNRMICSLYTGGPTEPDPENHSMYAESLDNGATWSKPRILFVNRRRSCHASTFFHGFDRPFAFVHTMHPYTYAQEVRTNFSWFDAEDDSWSVPSTVRGRCAFRAMPGMLAANGDAVFPVYWAECCNSARPFVPSLPEWSSDWKLKHVEPYYTHACGVIRSSDGGQTFRQDGYIAAPGVDLWEPTVVELEPDHLFMFMRAEKTEWLYKAESKDGGITWSAPVPSDIPNPGTKPRILKVGNAIILFHNPSKGVEFKDRRRLEIWVSRDGLASWELKLALADAGTSDRVVCYPDMLVDEERRELAVVVDTARKVFFQRVPMADLGL